MREAIDSVFAQTLDSWELLLVDDGSNDSSTEIAREHAQRHPRRVRYIEHPGHQNRGMSASRNAGIRRMRGEYLGFLDADDVWLRHKLQEQIAILKARPAAGMTYGRAMIWNSWTGRPTDRDYQYDLGVASDRIVQPPCLLPVLLRNKAQTPMTGNVLLRREVVERVGGFEESFRAMYEDQVFFAKVELHTPVYVSEACWLWYRQHPESCTAGGDSPARYLAERKPFLMWLEQYMAEQNIPPQSPVWAALRKELWPYRHPLLYGITAPALQLPARAKLFLQGK